MDGYIWRNIGGRDDDEGGGGNGGDGDSDERQSLLTR